MTLTAGLFVAVVAEFHVAAVCTETVTAKVTVSYGLCTIGSTAAAHGARARGARNTVITAL